MERQWSVNNFWHCIMENPEGCAMILSHNHTIGRLAKQNLLQRHCFYILKMSVNGALTTFGLASLKTQGLTGNLDP